MAFSNEDGNILSCLHSKDVDVMIVNKSSTISFQEREHCYHYIHGVSDTTEEELGFGQLVPQRDQVGCCVLAWAAANAPKDICNKQIAMRKVSATFFVWEPHIYSVSCLLLSSDSLDLHGLAAYGMAPPLFQTGDLARPSYPQQTTLHSRTLPQSTADQS